MSKSYSIGCFPVSSFSTCASGFSEKNYETYTSNLLELFCKKFSWEKNLPEYNPSDWFAVFEWFKMIFLTRKLAFVFLVCFLKTDSIKYLHVPNCFLFGCV